MDDRERDQPSHQPTIRPSRRRVLRGLVGGAGGLLALPAVGAMGVRYVTAGDDEDDDDHSGHGGGENSGPGSGNSGRGGGRDDEREGVFYPVRVDLASAPGALKLGMSAQLNITLREAPDVLYVPSNALRRVDGQSVVTVVSPAGQVRDVAVRTGSTYGANVEILSGVAEGDVVAVFTPAPASGAARRG